MIDLHLHTNISDGSDTPIELLTKLKEQECNVFSVTDHDSIQSNKIILPYLNECKSIRFISGCEISAVFEGRNLHLLCYNFDLQAQSMLSLIEKGSRLRHERVHAMFEHLKTKHGIELSKEVQDKILAKPISGKVHIANAVNLTELNIDRQIFFDNFLNDMDSRHFKIEAEDVIDAAAKGGGIVSFAHPIEVQKEYNLDDAALSKMVKRLKDIGLCAIEVYHSKHDEAQVLSYKSIANKISLKVSCGSDYHGLNKAVKIGQLTKYGYVPSLKEITILDVL